MTTRRDADPGPGDGPARHSARKDEAARLAARKASLADELMPLVDRRRRHWIARRAVSAAAVLLALAAPVAWSLLAGSGGSGPGASGPGTAPRHDRTARSDGPSRSPADHGAAPRIERVGTDPGVVARFAVRERPVPAEWIVRDARRVHVEERLLDDRALGAWLAEAGVDPGRVRVGDRVRVLALDLGRP